MGFGWFRVYGVRKVYGVGLRVGTSWGSVDSEKFRVQGLRVLRVWAFEGLRVKEFMKGFWGLACLSLLGLDLSVQNKAFSVSGFPALW